MGLSRRVRESGLLASVLVVVVTGSVAAEQRQVPPQVRLDVTGYLLLVGAVAALTVRTRWLAGVAMIIGGYLLLGYSYGPIFLAASVAAFALAGVDSAGASVAAVVGGVGLWVAAAAVHIVPEWSSLAGAALSFTAWLIIPVWLATARGRRHDAAAAVAEQRRRELGEQRLELAREVHDVVAHNLTVIGVQAGAALRVFERDPDRARQALEAIARTNRQALAELRDTVDLLRSADDTDDDVDRRAPAGGLAEVTALVESARNAGPAVALHVTGPVDAAVAPRVERAAYRILQESLTNALRHAPGSEVTVRLDHEADRLHIRVDDDGPGLRSHPEGRGILGMRERAAAVGGTLRLSADGSGLTVCAQLPRTGGPR